MRGALPFPPPSTRLWDRGLREQAIPSRVIIEGEPLLNAFQKLQLPTQARSLGRLIPSIPCFLMFCFPTYNPDPGEV